jgi:hypothetical protein
MAATNNLVALNRKAGNHLEQLGNVSGAALTNFEKFERPWARLCAAHPRQSIPEATLQIYFEKLQEFDPEEIAEAVEYCIEKIKWFPSPAELRDRIESERPPPRTGAWAKPLNSDHVKESRMIDEKAERDFDNCQRHLEAGPGKIRREGKSELRMQAREALT